MSNLTLHAVIVKKPKTLEEAKEIAKSFINPRKKYYRETNSSYRFRNFPKNEFENGSFKTKKINNDVSLVFGKHKTGKDELVQGGGLFDDLKEKLGNFLLKYNPLSIMVRSTIENANANRK